MLNIVHGWSSDVHSNNKLPNKPAYVSRWRNNAKSKCITNLAGMRLLRPQLNTTKI